ncbi:hypothetical protein MAHJHV30_45220 [Mycobacterium avium subsp. hominissuis]
MTTLPVYRGPDAVPLMAPSLRGKACAAKDLVPNHILSARDPQRGRVRGVTTYPDVVAVTVHRLGCGGVYRFWAAPNDGWRTLVDAGRRAPRDAHAAGCPGHMTGCVC